MYDLNPRAVFAHKRVFSNPRAVARMERMLDAMGLSVADVPIVDISNIHEMIHAAGTTEQLAENTVRSGHGRVRQGHLKLQDDPVMFFTTNVWDESERVLPVGDFSNPHSSRLQRQLCGVGEDFVCSRRQLHEGKKGYVCQGGWGIHTLSGCVHKCDYCGQGFIVTVFLDIEHVCEHLEKVFAERPEQLLYRYDLYSDILAFEPEYGASETLAECFARNGRYLLLYTRSDNVRFLGSFPERVRKNVLVNWTLSMDTQARTIERDSPSLADRIAAMRFCQDEGYTVRAGFSPIIPVADWRRETTEMLEQLFSEVQPDVLRGWVLAMMEADEFETMFDTSAMDPWCMQRLREEREALAGLHHAPFPLDVRAEIYRHYLDETARISPETPFALCTESPELWDLFRDKLAMKRSSMYCCCGGLSVPERRESLLSA